MIKLVRRIRFVAGTLVSGGLLSLAPLAFPGPIYAAEGAKPAVVWSDTLRDLNGLWVSNTNGQAKLFFSRDISGVVDPTGPSMIKPLSVNPATGDVTFLLVPTDVDRLALSRGLAILSQNGQSTEEAPSTLRRVWDKQHQSFSLMFYSPNGGGTAYSFVRELTPQEAASFEALKAGAERAEAALVERLAKKKEQDAANQRSKETVVAKLSLPEVKAAADRLGIGQEFYRMTPEAQAQTMADALRSSVDKLKEDETWLNRLENQKPVSDAAADINKKQMAELRERIASQRRWQADLVTVDAALKGGTVAPTPAVASTRKRPPLGIVITDANRDGRGLKTIGIQEVVPGSLAERAGFRVGDIVESLNGEKIIEVGDVGRFLDQMPVGGKATFAIVRNDRPQQIELSVPPVPAN